MEKRETFNNAARVYDESRPSYPDYVIDWIINQTRITTDCKLLEIGSGTGQATNRFAERGYSIHCVEMGKNLADVLIQKYGNYDISVDVSTFEEWQPQSGFRTSFIFCATAFHWIDKNIRYAKCFDLLSDVGYLVLIWNVSPEIELPEVKKAYEYLWEHYPEKRQSNESVDDIKNARKNEIVNSGLFILDNYLDYKWKLRQTKENFTKGFFSQSSYLALDTEKQKQVYDKVHELYKNLDDDIETDFYTTVYIAKKA
jgi:SAM-dependent methyltransferase